ncbi:MAG: hypothetical protein M1818_001739 [Claussenomyces sp. TS43310]|nr:MAG: hypothetical protein M1818_001739 [Claussenomyces sp. TS43310]
MTAKSPRPETVRRPMEDDGNTASTPRQGSSGDFFQPQNRTFSLSTPARSPFPSPHETLPTEIMHTPKRELRQTSDPDSVHSLNGSAAGSTLSISAQAQQSYFELLEEICTEAARRKWQSEVERRLAVSFGTVRRQGPHRRRQSQHRTSRFEPAGRGNWSLPPFNAPLAAAADAPAACYRFMDYVSMIANATWENACVHVSGSHEAESLAADDMSMLYAMAMRIAGIVEVAAGGEAFGVEELKDLALDARGLCRFLDYQEGASRCDEMVEEWITWSVREVQ